MILHQDISVAKLALDNEKSNFPKTARRIQRKEIARDGKIPDKLKIGRFSKKEDSVIIQNWQELLKKANLENQSIETIQNSVFNPSNISKENQNQAEIQMIKNLIGYWLSMGLTHTRLSCEVFQRLNVLSNTTGGEFSAEEDKLVIQYVQQNGRKWKELSKMTGRLIKAILGRYDSLLLPSLQNRKLKKGHYSIENDLQIMAAVLKHNPKAIENGKMVSREVWKELGSQLGRYPVYVTKHWREILHPLLVRHKAGKLDTDFAEPIVDYMLRNKLEYCQDVDWESLAKLLPGSTGPHLHLAYRALQGSTKKKYNLDCPDVTAEAVKKFIDERRVVEKRKAKCERDEILLEYYERELAVSVSDV